MKKNERLFLAIGSVDEDLLARCEQRPRRRLWTGALAAAACLALILAALLPRLGDGNTVTPPGPGGPDIPPVVVTPDGTFEPQRPDAVFHLLRLTDAGAEEDPGFTIYINEELYYLTEDGGDYVVRPRDTVQVPDTELPACELRISHQPYLSLEEAERVLPERWRERYPDLSEWEDSPLTGGLRLWGSDGLEWDAAYLEAYLVEDGRGGVYVLTIGCFMEAAEGHGQRFVDMVRTFRPAEEGLPAWMTALDQAARRLTRAILSDDLSGAADLLAEGAEIDGYGEDVSRYAGVSRFDYTVDDVQAPTRATVSVQCRVDLEESWDYLTIEMVLQEGQWLASWAGIEK